jgi:TPP-dependent pyruvate/acetoin dehydrogenase alpha subunit
MRDMAYGLIRVLDDDGVARGPWAPAIAPETLRAMLRAMMLTRAFDDRMFRAQRQGKTSFYVKSLGEEAVSIGAAFALDDGDMLFPSYRQQGLLIARNWDLVDMMNQILSNRADRMKGRQLPVMYSAKAAGFSPSRAIWPRNCPRRSAGPWPAPRGATRALPRHGWAKDRRRRAISTPPAPLPASIACRWCSMW